MTVSRTKSGKWLAYVRPAPTVRFRRLFRTKAEALRFESLTLSRYQSGLVSPSRDNRRLSELLRLWFDLHGCTLSDGVRRLSILNAISSALGDPVAASFKGLAFAAWRSSELEKGVSGKTLNNRLGYLSAVFNKLSRLGVIAYANPLLGVSPLKLQEKPLSYLTSEQITQLFDILKARCVNPHVVMVASVCLATGCRWSEAEALCPARVRGGLVEFINTKSKRRRSVPISLDLEAMLYQHWSTFGAFTSCLNSFDKVVRTSDLSLPAGQSSHILRHTFASHFIMNGGDILTLQKILGHSSLAMTLRYSHLSPEHLREAVRFSPWPLFGHFTESENKKAHDS